MDKTDYSDILNEAAEVISSGGVVLHPTATVWGLACDATNQTAVNKISAIKERPQDKSYIVLVAADYQIEQHVEEVPDVAWELIDCTTSPLTIIYPKGKRLAKNVCADDGSIAMRISTEKFIQDLIKKTRKPLISTSANLSQQPTPLTFNEISSDITAKADYIVNLPSVKMTGKPSSIIKVGLNGEINIIRK